jgi:hypothetical protein
MTRTMAAHAYVASTSIIAVIGLLASRSSRRRQAAPRAAYARRARSRAVLRFRPARPCSREWEPLRITVSELRTHGLHQWPNAPGIYLAREDSVHCRRCLDDHAARTAILSGRDEAHRVLVLFGGPAERALVDANCATHGPGMT